MLTMLLSAASPAIAEEVPETVEEVPETAGDIAATYGRNFGQELMVASLAGELKWQPDPHVALGGRTALQFGAGIHDGAGRAFLGMPVLAKVELFPTAERNRPFAGLGAGLTFTRAGGGGIGRERTRIEGWYVGGPLPTLMPEIGVDIGMFRVSAQYTFLLGGWAARSASLDAGGVSIGREAPVLNGASLQLGAHFGGPTPIVVSAVPDVPGAP